MQAVVNEPWSGPYRAHDPQLAALQQAAAEIAPPPDKRLLGVQDLAWALLNANEFYFNH